MLSLVLVTLRAGDEGRHQHRPAPSRRGDFQYEKRNRKYSAGGGPGPQRPGCGAAHLAPPARAGRWTRRCRR
ncbi:hypothetical protein EVAR_31517_1 [Eumeta japonica]|uniref:Uncharacterized protein n=1 Tax=Eumeta variegata TaxID=151549 RepID=A0A4C1Z3J8_EUMVA|nr:hypothetical protein EVAR_31517_1 [Eumeta japonica]